MLRETRAFPPELESESKHAVNENIAQRIIRIFIDALTLTFVIVFKVKQLVFNLYEKNRVLIDLVVIRKGKNIHKSYK